ncbi:MAG: hypothetical protein ABII12_04775 [Planctomycetota bacterium]
MDANQRPDEKLARPVVLPGAIVAIVAMVGVDCAVSAVQPVERTWKGPSIVARTVVPANSALLASAAGLSLGTAAFVALLLFGRQTAFVAYRFLCCDAPQTLGSPWPAMLLRARMSISYHTGGRYGP